MVNFNANFFCKKYEVKTDRWIKIDDGPQPVVIQDIKFEFPSYIGPKKLNIKGLPQAIINFKNYGDSPVSVRIAIALFDESGNLVGCGTTASKFGVTRAGKEERVVIVFSHVRSNIDNASHFLLTVETE